MTNKRFSKDLGVPVEDGNMDAIQGRQKSEEVFHDARFCHKEGKNFCDQGFISVIFDSMLAKLGNIEGKEVVELGYGAGWLTKIPAGKGGEAWAFNKSKEAINIAQCCTESKNI